MPLPDRCAPSCIGALFAVRCARAATQCHIQSCIQCWFASPRYCACHPVHHGIWSGRVSLWLAAVVAAPAATPLLSTVPDLRKVFIWILLFLLGFLLFLPCMRIPVRPELWPLLLISSTSFRGRGLHDPVAVLVSICDVIVIATTITTVIATTHRIEAVCISTSFRSPSSVPAALGCTFRTGLDLIAPVQRYHTQRFAAPVRPTLCIDFSLDPAPCQLRLW